MALIDCITFNGEYDLFNIRYNILKNYVDKFVVVEAPTTFSGLSKPLYFKQIKRRYDDIFYYVVDEKDPKLWDMARKSPNTMGGGHWLREFVQKESIKKALAELKLKDDDLVYVGDCDEIWDPDLVFTEFIKLKLRVYTYYLNNRSNEQFWGTIVAPYKLIKNNILNHLRVNAPRSDEDAGWHFTSLQFGLKRKLQDSYTAETYANPWVMSNLNENIKNNRDFLGRDFEYNIDENDWPDYLKKNRYKYERLLKIKDLI